MPFLVGPTGTGNFRRVFQNLKSKKRNYKKVEFPMDKYISNHISYFGFGVVVILSVAALTTCFKAGQLLERSNIVDGILKLELKKLNLKLQKKFLSFIFIRSNMQMTLSLSLIIKIDLLEIMEKFVRLDETIPDNILGLNQIYLDLVEHGSRSEYFAQALELVLSFSS